ncbi:MAG: bifunctional 3-deoxy-7-phosphoheptulonate synthase/chorismate mutase type II [Halobacteriovoraceae bacterium]|nr:bifunctional 3-deoxy-7-phosphoheptulonate synthase/chorismate mutase type II [Halobacteriovoraceae bacterium]
MKQGISFRDIRFTPLSRWIPHLSYPLIIAGPCSAESEKQVLETAKALSREGRVRIFRAGIWKPRTRPGGFSGVGEKGLLWLKKVKESTHLLTAVEVANKDHVSCAISHGVDVLWVGARTTANPFAIQEIADALAGHDLPVLVKNPINIDLPLWIGAIERFYANGITKLIAVHRGFSSYEQSQYRHHPLWRLPMELKSLLPRLPIICDPSHIAGRRDLIHPICQKAMDKNMDGLMVEVHCDPQKALSDSSQQITPAAFSGILSKLIYKREFSEDEFFMEKIKELRDEIDLIDSGIIDSLKTRMQIVEKIGKYKEQKKITAFQLQRLRELMKKRIDMGETANLPAEYIREIFQIIHEESVKRQSYLS